LTLTILISSASRTLSSLYYPRNHPDLHSFPTRRSSDLTFRNVPTPGGLEPAATKLNAVSAVNVTSKPSFTPMATPLPLYSQPARDRKSTRLNSSHVKISYAVFCLKKKNKLKKGETR